MKIIANIYQMHGRSRRKSNNCIRNVIVRQVKVWFCHAMLKAEKSSVQFHIDLNFYYCPSTYWFIFIINNSTDG